MRTKTVAKTTLATLSLAACLWMLAACSTINQSTPGLTGGVAATVNGVEIPEDKVTEFVESTRAQMGLSEADAWGQWLVEQGLTPEQIREQSIDNFVDQELLLAAATDAGITVEDSEVDQYLDSMKSRYESDEEWQDALSQIGMTEDEYRESLHDSLLSRQFVETLDTEEPTDEEILEYAQLYAPTYKGSKRSSHILFDANDQEKAQQVLDQINNGEISFADAAAQYSQDTGSASQGGDVGWDSLSSFVGEYQSAVNDLEPGQISGLVTSDYGIHIITVTDVFNPPDEFTSIDQLPEAFLESIRSQLESQKQSAAYQEWLSATRESADIVINEFNTALPYYVDLSAYQTEDTEGGEGTETDTSTDSGTEGSGTEGETSTEDTGTVDTPEEAAEDSVGEAGL